MLDYERIPPEFEEDFPLKKESPFMLYVWKSLGIMALALIVGTLIWSIVSEAR